jgi:hypothetical protein
MLLALRDAPFAFVIGQQIAAQHRANAKHLEEIGRNRGRVEVLRRAVAGQRGAVIPVAGDPGEGVVLLTPIEEVGIS